MIKTFVITLPETETRNAKAMAHFKEIGLDAIQFTGIHAATSGLRTVHNYEVDNPGSGWNIGPNPTGCWISHYMLWGALNVLSDNHYLALESDAKFPSNWKERFNKAMFDAPADFDFLFVGSCCCQGKPTTHVKGEVFDVRYPFCTHAYVVAAKCLPYIIKTMRKVWAPIDLQMPIEIFPQLKVYTVKPRIVDQFDTVLKP